MKTGFLIVNYNDFKSTITLINNISKYKCIDTIVIVDNNSTDNSVKELNKIVDGKIKLVIASSNKGYSAGINLGIKYLIKQYKDCNVIISNADIIINRENDIKSLVKLLEIKDVAVVAPTIIENQGKNRGWIIPKPMIDVLMNIPYIHKYFRKKYLVYDDNYYSNDVSVVEAVSGCFFLMRASIVKQIGYFDEKVFLYYEENILGSKIKGLNLKTIVSNRVEVVHNHSVTIDKNIKKINKYKMLKQSQAYFQKNYNKANVFERGLLFITNKLTLGVLYVVYFIKG